MFILGQLLVGLAWIHLFWIYFFITGTLVRTKETLPFDPAKETASEPFSTADFVITTVTGMALTGFIILLIGSVGLLNAGAVPLWLVVEGFLFKVIRGETVFSRTFWLTRFRLTKRAWTLPTLIIYCVFLIISVPAILPPIAFDATSYHLAYAIDWANSGRIYTDEFLRAPYYANNFLLLYALMFTLKLGPICHFLTWLCGLLTSLGVFSGIVQETVKGRDKNTWAEPFSSLVALMLALGLGLSPLFLRWVNTGFVDIPIGLFLLVPVLCTYRGLQNTTRSYENEFVLTAAFAVGMKIVLILFLPLFLLSLVIMSMKRGFRLPRIILLLSMFLVLSAPWYLRNFVRTGDPISPTLNMLLGRRDPIWSRADYDLLLADLRTPKSPVSLIRLPYDLFWNTTSKNLREYGTSPVVLLLYVPIIMAFLLFFRRVRRWFGWPFVYLNIVLIYLLAYWIGISSLARYFLHLFPVYLVYLGIWLNSLPFFARSIQNNSRLRLGATLLITASLPILMIFPSPTTKIFYRELVQTKYLELTVRFRGYREYLRQNLTGYASTQYIIARFQSNDLQNEKVMLVGFENLSYYFRKNHIISFGDWFGIGRHADLVDSVNRGDLSSYLTRFNVRAVLCSLSRMGMDDETFARFTKQLEENQFVLQPAQESDAVIYLKAH